MLCVTSDALGIFTWHSRPLLLVYAHILTCESLPVPMPVPVPVRASLAALAVESGTESQSGFDAPSHQIAEVKSVI